MIRGVGNEEMDHLKPVMKKIQKASVGAPPPPWEALPVFAVGGLVEVGFAEGGELLLVISSQGRGVIDCSTGEKVARDSSSPDDPSCSWFDDSLLIADGIGPLEGRRIRLSGLSGGGLPRGTPDGWNIESIVLDWPHASLLLVSPWQSIFQDTAQFAKLGVESEVRAFGFSYTGNTLVLATSSDLTIWKKG